ncbi:hypothetical protein SAMN02927895_05696 [Belnapia rosea]|nr:hypothetical protein SAMN02927895_05696 [Belnapia rosea]
MLRMGWYRAVTAKSFTAHERLALLAVRHRLVEIRVQLDRQIRGLLKTFGLIVGPGNTDALIRRAEALAEGNATISGLVAKLAEVQRHVVAQVTTLRQGVRQHFGGFAKASRRASRCTTITARSTCPTLSRAS